MLLKAINPEVIHIVFAISAVKIAGNMATCCCKGDWEKMEALASELLPFDNTHGGVALLISATRISDLSPGSLENEA